MNDEAPITLAVLNYDGRELLDACLPSVLAQVAREFNQHNSVQPLTDERYRQIRVPRRGKNLVRQREAHWTKDGSLL